VLVNLIGGSIWLNYLWLASNQARFMPYLTCNDHFRDEWVSWDSLQCLYWYCQQWIILEVAQTVTHSHKVSCPKRADGCSCQRLQGRGTKDMAVQVLLPLGLV